MRKSPEVLPHVPPPGRWVHGTMISLPPWLEAKRRGGLSAGQGATHSLRWQGGSRVRAAVRVARVALPLPALAEVGPCQWAGVPYCWMPGLSCQPAILPALLEPGPVAAKVTPGTRAQAVTGWCRGCIFSVLEAVA